MANHEPVFVRDADGKKVQLLPADQANRGDRVSQMYADELAATVTRQRQLAERDLSRRAAILAQALLEDAVGVMSRKMQELEDRVDYKTRAVLACAEDAMAIVCRVGFVKDFVSDDPPTTDYLRNGEWCFWVDTSGTEDAVFVCRRIGDDIKKSELV